MKFNPESIARASSHRPWRVVVGWAIIIVLAFVASGLFLSDALTTDFDFTDEPESKRARLLVEERLRGPGKFTEIVVVTSASSATADASFETYIGALVWAIDELGPDKVDAVFPVGQHGQPVFSPDGRSRLVTVVLADPDLDIAADHAIELQDAIATVSPPSGVVTRLFGQPTLNNDFVRLAEEGLKKGESIGIVVALIVLLVVIAAIVAALLPIFLAIAAIATAIGLTALVGNLFDLSFFVVNFITMIGLAVGIDYALFIVARYREERARGHDKLEAIGRTGATANRAVFFSGLTVVLALSGLLFVPNTIFRSLAIGAILVVLLAMAASMSLLPAIFSLLGDHVNKGRILVWLRIQKPDALQNIEKVGGFWDKITHSVMGRPVIWLTGGVALLALLTISFFSMSTGFSGVTTLPDDLDSKQAFQILKDDFGAGGTIDPVEVVIDGPITPAVEAAVANLQASMASDVIYGTAAPLQVNGVGNLALLSVPLSDDFQTDAATDAVKELRSNLVPAAFNGVAVEVLVGGASAFNVDFFDDVSTFTPIVFAWVLGLSLLLLTVVFRSIVVPVKAILMNLLSVGAAYGAVVLAFQAGTGPSWVKNIFGFQQVGGLEAWLPLFLFAVLFGLSMDYHVFLLTRIREHFDKTGDNQAAVAHGLRTTGAIITGAALIMVAVFGGFAAGELVPLQQMGFGLAIAVILDATIVRSILVPAAMRLLGEYNWYLPSWLEWLPKIEIEGHDAAEAALERAVS